MADDWNQAIVDEFRANDGLVGGRFEGVPLLLLHSIGAKTGLSRLTPLMYQADGDRLVIFASKAGAPTDPDWYHNLVANPRARVEVRSETYDVIARVAKGDERERVWTTQKERYPFFAEYEQKAGREIPVFILERGE